MKKLPDVPSELLLLALSDLEQVENDPRYVVDMGTWHSPNGRCTVCFAGSVMAGSLGVPPSIAAYPSRFDDATQDKMLALDALRGGLVRGALDWLKESVPAAFVDDYEDVDGGLMLGPDYHGNRAEWWLHMQTIVGVLQAEGL